MKIRIEVGYEQMQEAQCHLEDGQPAFGDERLTDAQKKALDRFVDYPLFFEIDEEGVAHQLTLDSDPPQ
jgi:hypothetical protein